MNKWGKFLFQSSAWVYLFIGLLVIALDEIFKAKGINFDFPSRKTLGIFIATAAIVIVRYKKRIVELEPKKDQSD